MHDIDHMLPTQFLRMRELLMVRFRAVFSTVNITDAQWRAIRVIHERGTIDFSLLSEIAIIAKPSLSRVISGLEERGIVERAGVEADQRQIALSLTQAGHDFVAELKPRINEVYQGILVDLGADRMEHVSGIVAECIEALEHADSTVTPSAT